MSSKGQLRFIDFAKVVLVPAVLQGGTSLDDQHNNVNGEKGYFSQSMNACGKKGLPATSAEGRCSLRHGPIADHTFAPVLEVTSGPLDDSIFLESLDCRKLRCPIFVGMPDLPSDSPRG